MITKVELKNWKSHLDSKLTFSEGTNAFLGPMGSGKTSITDGICFTLFGTFPTLQSRKIKLDDVIMNKPIEKDKASLSVSFQINGDTYTVKRIVERGKGTTYSEIRRNDKLLEAPNSQRVTETVEKVLKVNYELFSKAIYSEQNALDYFLTIPKGDRLKKMDELLMIDKFEKARASCVSLRNKLIERKLGKQSIVDQIDMMALQKSLDELKNSTNELLNAKTKLEKELNVIEERRKKAEEEVNELEKINKEFESLRREEVKIDGVINEIGKTLKELEEFLDDKKPEEIESQLIELTKLLEKMSNELNEKRQRQSDINRKISELKTKLEFLQKEKKKLINEFEEKQNLKKKLERIKNEYGNDVKIKLNEKRKNYEKTSEEIQTIKEKLNQLEETVNELSGINGKCPVCESKVSEERKSYLIKRREEEMHNLRERLKQLKKQKEIDKEHIKKLEEVLDTYKLLIEKTKDLDSVKNELENIQKNVTEFFKLIEHSEKEFMEFKKDVEILEKEMKLKTEERQRMVLLNTKIQEYNAKKRRLSELEDMKKEIKKRLEDIEQKIGERDLEKIRKEFRNLVAYERELEGKIEGNTQLIKERQNRIEEYELKIKTVKEQREEIVKLEKIIKNLQIFEKALEETQTTLRREFVEAINFTMNQLWVTLYPYDDFYGIALNIEGGDYILQLKDRMGRWVNVDGIASGGERSIACLALRIAFAMVLAPQLRWLILDEPTMNLDSKGINVLATTLRERIRDFVEQCFLITHEPGLEEAITGSAYRLERDKSRDGATKITPIS